MNLKVNYKLAVKLLTAYLGCNICIEKPCKRNFSKCQVIRMKHCQGWMFEYKLIAESDTWEGLFFKIFPNELYTGTEKPDYWEPGYAAKLYQFRHIGKNL